MPATGLYGGVADAATATRVVPENRAVCDGNYATSVGQLRLNYVMGLLFSRPVDVSELWMCQASSNDWANANQSLFSLWCGVNGAWTKVRDVVGYGNYAFARNPLVPTLNVGMARIPVDVKATMGVLVNCDCTYLVRSSSTIIAWTELLAVGSIRYLTRSVRSFGAGAGAGASAAASAWLRAIRRRGA